MTEKNSAGFKEFILSILWAIGILMFYDLADTFMRLYTKSESYAGRNMVLTGLAVLGGCVLVYFVMTRYAAAFFYELNGSILRLTRKIGHRTREIEIKLKGIRGFSKTKPANMPKTVHKMRKSVFSNKRVYYLTYIKDGEAQTVEFEPSARLARMLTEKIKER